MKPKDMNRYLTAEEARRWLEGVIADIERKQADGGLLVKLDVVREFHHPDWEWMKQQPGTVRSGRTVYYSEKSQAGTGD